MGTPWLKLIMMVVSIGCAMVAPGARAVADTRNAPGMPPPSGGATDQTFSPTPVSPRALFYDEETPASVTAQPAKPTTRQAAKPASANTPAPARKAPAQPAALALRATVRLLDDSGGYTEVSPTRVFRSGERIRLGFTANKRGFFYLATIGASGEAKLIVPAQDGPSVTLGRDITYEFPVPRKVLTFRPPEGKEEIYALLSEAPLEAIEVPGGRRIAVPRAPIPGGGQPPTDAVASLGVRARDLVVEEDDTAMYAAMQPVSDGQRKPPIVLKLTLEHRGSR